MSENTEMILEGTLCQVCGALMEDLVPDKGNKLKDPPGFPRTCEDCLEDEEDEG